MFIEALCNLFSAACSGWSTLKDLRNVISADIHTRVSPIKVRYNAGADVGRWKTLAFALKRREGETFPFNNNSDCTFNVFAVSWLGATTLLNQQAADMMGISQHLVKPVEESLGELY